MTRTSDSIARRINAERLMLVAWGRAILLQFAHPLIAAGVADHSSFRASPRVAVSRLHHTIRAMLSLTFGNAAEYDETIAQIRHIHTRVHGHLRAQVGPYAGGTRYSAEDPELVLWVHLTLLDSIPLAYDLFVQPLTDEERDAYCREAVAVAVALGAHDARVPRSWAEVRAAFDRTLASGTLHVGDDARTLARALLAPPFGTAVMPLTWMNRTITLGLLPPSIRQQYGFTWSPTQERAFRTLVPTLRRLRHTLPSTLALWPEARA